MIFLKNKVEIIIIKLYFGFVKKLTKTLLVWHENNENKTRFGAVIDWFF